MLARRTRVVGAPFHRNTIAMQASIAYLKGLLRSVTARHDTSDIPRLTERVSHVELVCAYQPVVHLSSGTISGHEALVRKVKSETLGNAHELLDAVRDVRLRPDFELACVERAMAGWGHQIRHGHLFINITAKSLVNLEVQAEAGRLIKAIQRYGVPPARLVMEITEHGKFANVPELVQTTNKLRALGVSLAMDDVKGSEGSLTMWKKLSPDVVKLDQRLTQGVAGDDARSKAIRALVAKAGKFGCTLVAKGVESAQDLRALRELGVDFAQGYFLGSPDVAPVEILNLRASSVLMDIRQGNGVEAGCSVT